MNKIPVFYYHSVAPAEEPDWINSFLTYKLQYFSDFIQYLVRNRFKFISLDEYFFLKFQNDLSKNKLICITFDDGYLDNYVFVYPILKQYGAKATIFISPEFVQENEFIRPTLEDVWQGKVNHTELRNIGFISWNELRIMQESDIFDIQSHTLTHTKYFISDRIVDFHNPGSDYLYPISNLFPLKKPYYITDKDFASLIPFGTPFFEEESAITCRKVTINDHFYKECVNLLTNTDWNKYSFNDCFLTVEKAYKDYSISGKLITQIETDNEYKIRVTNELVESKRILEQNLNKPVNHVCWPHGDYNDFSHSMAKEVGYHSSSIVLKHGESNRSDDRFDRTGSSMVRGNRMLSLFKGIYKLNAYRDVFPYSQIKNLYYLMRYKSV